MPSKKYRDERVETILLIICLVLVVFVITLSYLLRRRRLKLKDALEKARKEEQAEFERKRVVVHKVEKKEKDKSQLSNYMKAKAGNSVTKVTSAGSIIIPIRGDLRETKNLDDRGT